MYNEQTVLNIPENRSADKYNLIVFIIMDVGIS